MPKCEGKVIAITGPRKAEEMSLLVAKQGGLPLVRPTQGTMFEHFDHLAAEVDKLIDKPVQWAVWTTGIGLEKLLEAAREAGREEVLLVKLKQIRHAARGYKTVNALKRLGIVPDIRDDDGSTVGLVRAMASYDADQWRGSLVALQLHGDPAPTLNAFLADAGAQSIELMPYRHTPPDEAVLEQFTSELLSGQIDAVAVTAAPQLRFLFAYAKERGMADKLVQIFQERTLLAAVGKVTAAAAIDEGIKRMLVPDEERMGALIVALSRWFEAN
jgi:uroporphyrinogen-III synthase